MPVVVQRTGVVVDVPVNMQQQLQQITAAFYGIFRTPPHGVESQLSWDFFGRALHGQQLLVVVGSGVAGTPGVKLPSVLPHVN